MGTQLILTVGTNPLPVWVAWYHLKEKLPKPIKVRLVHTANTVAERDRLQQHCQGAGFFPPIQTSAGDPETVRDDTRHILRVSAETTDFHVHYTGGTKAMGVETVSAIEAHLLAEQDIRLQTSYLDPRGASGPTIVSRSGPLIEDTRRGIDPCLSRIALLNGFMLGPFEYRYLKSRTFKTEKYPAPGTPHQDQLDEGRKILKTRYIADSDSDLFEYGAYAAFKEALERIYASNSDRNNYEIFHGVYVRRAVKKDPTVKPFELDVVAVLGYQIVVVSCTVGDNTHDRIKHKGMEAIIRARQLGGDEARAIVFCSAPPRDAKLIENELRDEMGSASEPLQVWGRDRKGGLSGEFYRYLRDDLHWI